jgi:hypothetical protein
MDGVSGANLCMFDAVTGVYPDGTGSGSDLSAPLVLNGAVYTVRNYNGVCHYVPPS